MLKTSIINSFYIVFSLIVNKKELIRLQPEATEKNCEEKIKQIVEIINPILNKVDRPTDDEIELCERIYAVLNGE